MKLAIFSLTIFVLSSLFSNVNAQSCDLKCPDNVVVTAEKGKEGAIVDFQKTTFPAICGMITYTPASGGFFRLGNHSIIVQSSTGQRCSFTVVVTDNDPPELSELSLSRTNIWPASNKMKKLVVNYEVKDNSEEVNTKISVSSNSTDGVKDWEIIDNHLVRLKSSRLPDGSVRVYTISVTATDENGNKTTRSKTISVSQPPVVKTK